MSDALLFLGGLNWTGTSDPVAGKPQEVLISFCLITRRTASGQVNGSKRSRRHIPTMGTPAILDSYRT